MRRGDAAASCEMCGRALGARDLQRGLAHAVDPRRFCESCRALHSPPPLPTRPVAFAPGPRS